MYFKLGCKKLLANELVSCGKCKFEAKNVSLEPNVMGSLAKFLLHKL